MKTHPFFASKFARFLAFILLWIVLANIYILLNPPKPIAIKEPYQKENFNVCIIKEGKPSFEIVKLLPPNPQFCQQPIKHIQRFNEAFYGSLEKVDNDWELTEYGDSMADPFVYCYRIEGNQVIPLWYSYGGGFVLHFTAGIISFFLTLIIYAIIKRVSCHKNKKPS